MQLNFLSFVLLWMSIMRLINRLEGTSVYLQTYFSITRLWTSGLETYVMLHSSPMTCCNKCINFSPICKNPVSTIVFLQCSMRSNLNLGKGRV